MKDSRFARYFLTTPILAACAFGFSPAEREANAPSAQLGLVAATHVLKDSLPEAKVEFLAFDCQSVAATEALESHVLVNLDLRVFGETKEAAKASFEKYEAALVARAKDTEAPGLGYSLSKEALPKVPFLGADPTELQLASSHQGRVEVALMGSALKRETPRPDVPDDAPAIAPENMMMFVRALAANDQVKIDPIALTQAERKSPDELERWTLRLKETKNKPAQLKATQLVNLLFLLESQTTMVNVGRVQFAGSASDSLKDLSILIKERRR